MSSYDLLAVIENMEKDRGIDRAALIQMVEAALMSASKKSVGPAKDLRLVIDERTLAIRAFAKVQIVQQPSEPHSQISLQEARKTKPDAQLGEEIEIEIKTKEFGRIAAQTAKQAIIQKIRQAEKEIVVKEYQDRLGDIVNGTVARFDRGDLILDLGRVEAIMPARERIQTEEYQIGDRVRAYVLSVQDHISGYHIVLSRSHPNFVKRLFELEVSEIADGTVEIKGIAREPGFRTKIAVASQDEKVDPVGACVGMKGMRVKNIVRELLGEKIDIVRWSADVKTYVTNALNPAKLNKVIIDDAAQIATVIVDADQLSLAIGKRGQNARLTSKLVGWKIDIQKDKDDISFEEKVAMAIEDLTHLAGVTREQAEKLVQAGFLTVEGILESDIEDLQEMAGLDTATAQAIQEAAMQAAQKPDAPTDEA